VVELNLTEDSYLHLTEDWEPRPHQVVIRVLGIQSGSHLPYVAEPPKLYDPHVLVIVLKTSNNYTCVPQNLRSLSGVLGKPESSMIF
jgi:hypothetical protein